MKQCIALAALACLVASGCATSGLGRGGQPAHVTMSQSASRPTITRDYRRPGPELGVQLAAFNDNCCDATCGVCEEGCGCAVEGCEDPYCNGGCGACDGCASGGPCRRLVDGIAGGFCGGHGTNGLCPHSGGYPEYTTFNQGPPVGQVAYPYYTTRGPRDFLRNHPPTIGPY